MKPSMASLILFPSLFSLSSPYFRVACRSFAVQSSAFRWSGFNAIRHYQPVQWTGSALSKTKQHPSPPPAALLGAAGKAKEVVA
ncbi:hypothetical protein BX070DRAFT_221851 [Coemansia spiralis]|nr:hypothetical protein BX070DRAFT_221851 [Coemansia spiralis]